MRPLMLAVIALSSLADHVFASPAAAPSRPNIVLILADDKYLPERQKPLIARNTGVFWRYVANFGLRRIAVNSGQSLQINYILLQSRELSGLPCRGPRIRCRPFRLPVPH